MKFGLIGEKLSHSYSQKIHAYRGLDYSLVEIQRGELNAFVSSRQLDGYNVTIPYKKDVMPLLDSVSDLAKSIGAVNTVAKVGGKLVGYNTDYFGIEYMLKSAGICLKDKTVLILGTGGASNTAYAYATNCGAKSVYKASRTGEINYQNLYELPAQVVINTTPVGMFPNNGISPIDIKRLPLLTAVADLIYNPLYTQLIMDAKAKGLKTANGLMMLVAQAVKAQSIWLNVSVDTNLIDTIYQKLVNDIRNIVLIGMPSSGKSTLGRRLANDLKKEFIDMDELIYQKTGKTPKEIILEKGECVFRDIESQTCLELGKRNGLIIATGGGSVLREENRYALKQNAICVLVERNLSKLVVNDRPLSKSKGIETLYEERKQIYDSCKDVVISNDGDINESLEKLKEIL